MKNKLLIIVFLIILIGGVRLDIVKAVSLENYDNLVITDKETTNKINVLYYTGTLKYTSMDDSIITVDDEGNITPLEDGITYIKIEDDDGHAILPVIVDINLTYKNEILAKLESVSGNIDINLVEGFDNLDINKEEYQYGLDYLYGEIWRYFNEDYNDEENYSISNLEVNDNNITFNLGKLFMLQIGDNSYTYAEYTLEDAITNIEINYKPFIIEDYNKVKRIYNKVKKVYNSYLNDTYDDIFINRVRSNKDLMINSSNLKNDIGNDIEYYLDDRMGNDDPRNAVIGGFLQLGINGTMYTTVETKFQRVLRVKKSDNIIDSIKNYFEENFLEENEEVIIEKMDDNTYQATITKNNKPLTLMGSITNFFIPKVSADDIKVVGFMVEEYEDDEIINNVEETVEVPNTFDNINIAIYALIISFIVFISLVIGLGKKVN